MTKLDDGNKLSVMRGLALVHGSPYPHACATDVLPDVIYRSLCNTRPTMDQILRGREIGSNLRYDLNAHELLTMAGLDPWWREFVAYHVSAEFWEEIKSWFAFEILRIYPEMFPDLGALDKLSVGMRHKGATTDIVLDCSIGLNTPVLEPGRVRGPHIDNPVEIWAAMFYMRDERDESSGGDFVVQRLNRAFRYYGKAEVPDQDVDEVRVIPYAANSMCCFVNSIESTHAVTPRDVTSYPRLLVNFVAEMRRPLFSYKQFRMENDR